MSDAEWIAQRDAKDAEDKKRERQQPCPFCKAGAGAPCVTKQGALYMYRGIELHHSKRRGSK